MYYHDARLLNQFCRSDADGSNLAKQGVCNKGITSPVSLAARAQRSTATGHTMHRNLMILIDFVFSQGSSSSAPRNALRNFNFPFYLRGTDICRAHRLKTIDMAIKIINTILMLFAAYMGIKHGWAGISGKTEVLEMFAKWNISKSGVMAISSLTLLGVVLMLIPKTFLWGSFLTAAVILLIICFHLRDRDLKGVLIEIPFLLLSLLIIYLKHPLTKAS